MLDYNSRDFMFPGSTIIVFSKAPEPGKTKTRLIPDIGSVKAVELHKAMTRHILSMVTEAHLCPVQLWCTPNIDHPFFKALKNNYSVTLHQQAGEGLGLRMHNAFSQALKTNNAAIIIGTDCLTLDATTLKRGLQYLHGDKDIVIAPAEDGGYVLLGLKRAEVMIFNDISWGTDMVYKQTLNRFELLGLSWAQMQKHWDIDRPMDIERLKHQYERMNLHPELVQLINEL